MLDISFIRAHIPVIKMTCKRRGYNVDVQKIVDADNQRKRLIFLIEQGKNNFKKLEESKKYYDEVDFINEKKKIIKEVKANQEKLKKNNIELKKTMMMLPNITDMQVPFGETIENFLTLKVVGKNYDLDSDNDSDDKVEKLRALDFFKKKNLIESGKIKFISDRNEFLMHPLASKIYISSWNSLFDFFARNNYLPFSAPQYLNQKFSNIFDFGNGEQSKKSALVLASFFASRFLNFGNKLRPKKFFSFRQEKREEFFNDYIFSSLIITSVDQIETDKEIQRLQDSFSLYLKSMNIPHKIMILPVSMMKKGDNKRIAIQAYFPAEGKYKTVWEVAYTRDFYTRRLSIRYKNEIIIKKSIEEKQKPTEANNFSEEKITKVVEDIVEKKYFPYLIYTSEINSFDIFELITQNNQNEKGDLELPKIITR